MYNVVIGVDDDEERALACARAVADLPGDASEKRITLLYSFTDNPSGGSATRVHAVREVEELLESRGLAYELTEVSGDPADMLLETAREEDADLVVLAGRRRSPTGKALFGSVTQEVILNADRPVLVAGMAEE